jgi:cytochrome c-type biogenesis protein CcmH/NrfG
LRIDPENCHAWSNLGGLYNAQNRFDEGEKAYKKALEIDPEQSYIRSNLENLYKKQQRLEEKGRGESR